MTARAWEVEATVRDALAALVPAWELSELADVEFLPWGYSNQNFRFHHAGERYVLRVPTRTPLFVDRQLEWDFYQRNETVRTIEVVAFEVVSGAMISRWHEAPLLADHPPDPAQLLDYLSALHGALPRPSRVYDPLALARSYLDGQRPEAPVSKLLAGRSWQPPVSAPCHNDLNPWNVLRDDARGWVTLDWEWHAMNDPLFDLVTLQQGLGGSVDELSTMAEAFIEDTDPRRLTDCLTAFWLREHAWACAEIKRGNERQEIIVQRETSLETLRHFVS